MPTLPGRFLPPRPGRAAGARDELNWLPSQFRQRARLCPTVGQLAPNPGARQDAIPGRVANPLMVHPGIGLFDQARPSSPLNGPSCRRAEAAKRPMSADSKRRSLRQKLLGTAPVAADRCPPALIRWARATPSPLCLRGGVLTSPPDEEWPGIAVPPPWPPHTTRMLDHVGRAPAGSATGATIPERFVSGCAASAAASPAYRSI